MTSGSSVIKGVHWSWISAYYLQSQQKWPASIPSFPQSQPFTPSWKKSAVSGYLLVESTIIYVSFQRNDTEQLLGCVWRGAGEILQRYCQKSHFQPGARNETKMNPHLYSELCNGNKLSRELLHLIFSLALMVSSSIISLFLLSSYFSSVQK